MGLWGLLSFPYLILPPPCGVGGEVTAWGAWPPPWAVKSTFLIRSLRGAPAPRRWRRVEELGESEPPPVARSCSGAATPRGGGGPAERGEGRGDPAWVGPSLRRRPPTTSPRSTGTRALPPLTLPHILLSAE